MSLFNSISRSKFMNSGTTELANMIVELRLKEYIPNFQKYEVTFSDLPNLKEEQLEEIIPHVVPRNRLKKFIKENFLQNKNNNGWEIDSELVKPLDKIVAEGSFGVVKTGEILIHGGTTITIACKQIMVDGVIVQKEKVINEVRMMATCHHPNILKCFGCYFSEDEKKATICLEYLPEGDLLSFYYDTDISPLQKVKYIIEIAKGIKYLHSKNIVHRDIKAANILLSKDLKSIKICDFGAAKISSNVKGTMHGTPVYLAPELFLGREIEEPKKIDVYSFGILMWELFCNETPHYDLQRKYHDNPYGFLELLHGRQELNTKRKKKRKSKKRETKKKVLRPDVYDDRLKAFSEIEELMCLMECCWEEDPSKRPDFPHIVEELKEILKMMLKIESDKKKFIPKEKKLMIISSSPMSGSEDEDGLSSYQYQHRNISPMSPMDEGDQVMHQLFGI